jgi:hypothetical protein
MNDRAQEDPLALARRTLAFDLDPESLHADTLTLAQAYLDLASEHRSYCVGPDAYLWLEHRHLALVHLIRAWRDRLPDDLRPAVDETLAREDLRDPPGGAANYRHTLETLTAAQAAGTALRSKVRSLRAALQQRKARYRTLELILHRVAAIAGSEQGGSCAWQEVYRLTETGSHLPPSGDPDEGL